MSTKGKKERIKRIVDILKNEKAVTITNLAATLKVSYMTIRRDLIDLGNDGLAEILNGVVMLKPDYASTSERKYSLTDAGSHMLDAKERIGRLAATFIKDNDIIIIDTGSTAEFLARNIPDNISVTILCYTINTLMEVYRKNCNIIFAGGYLHGNTLMFESPEGLALIKRNRATTAFVTASGISLELGVTCSNHYEDSVKRAILSSSQKQILLADSSKFGKVRSTYFADLEEFDSVITDTGLPEEYQQALKEKGLKIYLA